MRVRVLTEWPGSPPCGAVAELPESSVRDQLNLGNAELADPPVRLMPVETAAAGPAEVAVAVKGRRR